MKYFKIVANDPIKETKKYKGLNIDIEWPKGSIRTYKDNKHFMTIMKCDYGYVRNVEGGDGEELDIYLGEEDSDKVFIIEQLDNDGDYDEDKIMLGFKNEKEAKEMYLTHMPKERLGRVTEVLFDVFRKALKGKPQIAYPDGKLR